MAVAVAGARSGHPAARVFSGGWIVHRCGRRVRAVGPSVTRGAAARAVGHARSRTRAAAGDA